MTEQSPIDISSEAGLHTITVTGDGTSGFAEEFMRVMNSLDRQDMAGVLLVMKLDRHLSTLWLRYLISVAETVPQMAVVVATKKVYDVFNTIGFDDPQLDTHHFKSFIPQNGRMLPDRIDEAIARAKQYLQQAK